MLHTIRQVKVLQEYQLQLHFDTGAIRVADLERLLRESSNLSRELLDIETFGQVKCDGTTIYWPNGVDFCPDVLYQMSGPISKEGGACVKIEQNIKENHAEIHCGGLIHQSYETYYDLEMISKSEKNYPKIFENHKSFLIYQYRLLFSHLYVLIRKLVDRRKDTLSLKDLPDSDFEGLRQNSTLKKVLRWTNKTLLHLDESCCSNRKSLETLHKETVVTLLDLFSLLETLRSCYERSCDVPLTALGVSSSFSPLKKLFESMHQNKD